jgi:hypothetical protein
MRRLFPILILLTLPTFALEPVRPTPTGFLLTRSQKPFTPWGFNYATNKRLLEDFWDADWPTLAADFAEMKQLGANVVRLHLQFARFMDAPDRPNPHALAQLAKLLDLAEKTGLYLDLTGLACYRTADVPPWYDALDEKHRWAAQANFWSAVAQACAKSHAVFCYDLMNEPVVPGDKRPPGKWYSGKPLGGFDFVQFITLDPAGRKREDVAALWIRTLTAAIRKHDPDHPITVGLLPWVKGWGHLSGFIPETVAPELDFLAVHLYPETGQVPEALANLKRFAVKDKPVIIEETFPLSCPPADLRQFLLASRGTAHGWLGHYEGDTIPDLESRQRVGKLDLPASLMLEWLRLFRDLRLGDPPQR